LFPPSGSLGGLVSFDSAAAEAGHPQADEQEPDDPDWDPHPRDEEEEHDPDEKKRNSYATHLTPAFCWCGLALLHRSAASNRGDPNAPGELAKSSARPPGALEERRAMDDNPRV
jgi:hypothetical protein